MNSNLNSEHTGNMQTYCHPFPGHIARLVWAPLVYTLDVNCLKTQLEELYSCGLNLIRYDASDISRNESVTNTIIDSITKAIDSSEILSKHVKLNLCQGVILGNSKKDWDIIKNQYLDKSPAEQHLIYRDLVNKKIEAAVNRYKDNKYLFSWEIIDEPKWVSWHSDTKDRDPVCDEVRIAYDKTAEMDHKHVIYCNFAIPRGENKQGFYPNDMSLPNFIDQYDLELKPALHSYDLYPVIQYNTDTTIPDCNQWDTPVEALFRHFYEALHSFWSTCKKSEYKIPFWAFCLCAKYQLSTGTCYPFPKKEYMIWEAFSALAYGAQGISFYKYNAWYDDTSNENFYDGPYKNGRNYNVNEDGSIDDHTKNSVIWNSVKEVNQEIDKYEQIFVDCKVRNAVHAINPNYVPPIETAESDYDYKNLPLFESPLGPLTYIKPATYGVLVSYLTKNCEQFIVIVNHTPFESQNVTVNFNRNGVRLGWITAKSYEDVPKGFDFTEIKEDSETFTLEAGGFRILWFLDVPGN